MDVSLEAYVLINVCLNVITMGVIARSRGHVRWGAVLFASAVGALYAVAMQTEPFHQLRSIPAKIVLWLLLSACAMPAEGPTDFLSAALWMAGATLFMGGVQYLMRGLMSGASAMGIVSGALIGGTLLISAMEARSQRMERLEVQMLLRFGGGQVRLRALIDTGNRLHEPISGLPVVIVGSKHAKRLLPVGFDAAKAPSNLPPGFRLVGYGSLGGGGRMAVFRPDELLLSYGDGWMLAPDVWVGVYAGDMPGGVQALAPGVIGCVKPTKRRPEGVESKILQMRGNDPW